MAEDYYSQIAGSYNELYWEEQNEKLDKILEITELTGKILDIGSGTGVVQKRFKDAVQIDPSPKLLEMAEGEKYVASAEELPFKNETFDTIISLTAIHHADLDKAIKEIKRVAKPSANIVLTVLKRIKEHDPIIKKLKEELCLKEFDIGKDIALIKIVK